MQVGLGFHPEFTGRDNIEHALAYNGLTGAALEAAIEDVIDFAELGEFLRQPMKTYSLGMTTRLQFAAATAIRPDILIIDEILGAGDAYFSAKSAHRMRKLTSSGCTLLLVSHATEQILQFCDRAVWLDRGAVRADGKVLEVVQQYEEFIAGISAKADHEGTGVAASSDSHGSSFATPPWQQEAIGQVLLNGSPIEKLSRWPGVPGLLVSRVELADDRGIPGSAFRTGETIRIRVGIQIDRPGVYPLRLALLFMTEAGIAITRVLSPRFQIECQSAEESTFELVLPHNNFSQQTIIFSIAAFKEYDPEHPESAVKYDLLSRSCRFRIWGGTPNDPGIVSVAADWQAAS
jgi:lipopolysaccharide transport system ATP-binding protein